MIAARARGALVAVVLLVSAPVPACGPQWPEWSFVLERHPGPSLERFLEGELGIVPPRLGTADRLILYRHLSGISPPERTAVAFAPCLPAPSAAGFARAPAPRRWRDAVVAAGGPDPGWISTARRLPAEDDPDAWRGLFPNCLEDGFESALRTLAARIETWGTGSTWLREWIAAQTAVFANCGGGESTPAEPGEDWPPLLVQDRRYQIAAAHFYSDRWESARALFAEIGRDEDSPWSPLARYLVGRCELRLERWADAAAGFDRVLADPECQPWHESARGLREFARLRLDPTARGREILADLLAPEPAGDVRQELTDVVRRPGIVDPASPLGRWLSVDSAEQALALWHAEPTPANLALALALVDPDGEGAEELERAAAEIAPESPLALSAARFLAATAAARGEDDRVAALLDPWLARDDLSRSDRNRLSALRARAASSLPEYVHLILARPVADRSWGGELVVATEEEVPELLPPPARAVLERRVGLDGWLELAADPTLSPAIRGAFALHGYTRAVVVEQVETARAFAARLTEVDPKTGEPLAEAARSEDPGEWRFATALALLETPGASPWLELERPFLNEPSPRSLSPFRQNWWCAAPAASDPDPLPLPAFLRDAEPPALGAALSPGGGPAGVVLLGRRILEHADARRHDPRVPEALHLVVGATRHAPYCPDAGYGEVSRAAFERLHRRYPGSEWADKTPYWFDG